MRQAKSEYQRSWKSGKDKPTI